MAAPWADKFYASKAWRNLRKWYIHTIHGLCEMCGEPGLILHHKTRLTPENIDDENITLNPDNLQYVCLDCHNKTHAPKKIRRYTICEDGSIAPPNERGNRNK